MSDSTIYVNAHDLYPVLDLAKELGEDGEIPHRKLDSGWWSVTLPVEAAQIIAREVEGRVFEDCGGQLVPAVRARGATPSERKAESDRALGLRLLDVVRQATIRAQGEQSLLVTFDSAVVRSEARRLLVEAIG